MNKRSLKTLTVGGNLTAAALLASVFLIPMVYTFVSSLKSTEEIFRLPIRWIPGEIHWENYVEPLIKKNFGRYFFNSALVALVVTFSDLFLSTLAGYSLCKFRYRGRTFFFLLILVTMMVPIETTIVPLAVVVRKLGMMDTYWGLILPVLLTPFSIFWMRQFLISLPDAYAEAGRIDGLKEMQIFVHLILPLSKPALGALAIFTFMGNWNSLIWPLIVTAGDSLRTLPVGLVAFQGEFFTPYNQLFAMAFLAVMPTFIFFMFLRTKLIQGLAMVGVKG